MNDKTQLNSYAKINLALNIIGKSEDMHIIDTIVTNIDICDKIRIQKRTDKNINIIYTNLAKEIKNDTAMKIALLLQQEYDTSGMDIFIEKNIPFGAGLGGSSADAGGVARCMQKLFSLKSVPKEILLKVGSDVPYMFFGGTKRIKSKGEIIKEIQLTKAHYAIIVCPGEVNTGDAYSLYDKIGGENSNIDCIIDNIKSSSSETKLTNALQKASIILNPNIQKGLEYLEKAGFKQRVMTGSGSGVFGMEIDKTTFIKKVQMLKKILTEEYKLYLS